MAQTWGGSGMNFGRVTAGASASTTFTLGSGGGVSVSSGNGPGGVPASNSNAKGVISFQCYSSWCSSHNITVTITPSGTNGSPTGRALKLNTFTVSAGTATILSGPSVSTNSTTLTIARIPSAATRTLYVGGNMQIAADSASTATTAGGTYNVTFSANGSSSSTTYAAAMAVNRVLVLTEMYPLRFGTMVKPATGAGTANISLPATSAGSATAGPAGSRTVSLPAYPISSGDTPSVGIFKVVGDAGQTVSVSVDTSFPLKKSGAADIVVATSNTNTGSRTLPGTSGTGTIYFQVGGSFNLGPSQATGTYSGVFGVTALYQ